MIPFKGRAVRLNDYDLPRIAARIGCGEDEIHAVLDVEAAGGGFDAQGRPKMLFEPHKFWKELGPGTKRTRAVALGLAYPTWGEKDYPKESYTRLNAAIAIDREAALRSASWGLGQIMGSNYEAAGFLSVTAMVDAFCDSEAAQLEGMVSFIKVNRLDDELRTHNWPAFARGYNGPRYAEHNYDRRLAAAYSKWARIRDTPWAPGPTVARPIVATLPPLERPPKPVDPAPALYRPRPPAPVQPASAGFSLPDWLRALFGRPT